MTGSPRTGRGAKRAALDEALRAAAKARRVNKAKALLDAGANPRSKSDDGETALMAAAHGGSTACVELLVPVSDPKAIFNGKPAWVFAALRGNRGLASLLDVSDLDWRDERGRSVLMIAASLKTGAKDRWVVELLAGRCDLGERDNDGNTALMHAARGGGACFAALDGCDWTAKNDDGLDAADLAGRLGHKKAEAFARGRILAAQERALLGDSVAVGVGQERAARPRI